MTHEIKFSNASAQALYQLISFVPGLFTKPGDLVRSGEVSALLPERPPKDGEKEWNLLMYPPFELSDKQRDTIRGGLTIAASKGVLSGGKTAAELYRALGLED